MSDQQDEVSSDEEFPESPALDQSTSCKNIADNLVSVLRGVQNDAFGLENSKHGRVGRAVSKKLSKLNSYDAARASQKIMDILLLYDKDNPLNPNNVKEECFDLNN